MSREKCHAAIDADMATADRLPMLGGGPFAMAAGQTTDDTALAMALVRSLVVRRGFCASHVAAQYVRWYECEPPDVGVTTSNAFQVMGDGDALDATLRANARGHNIGSRANGSMMRQSPLGILGGVGACDMQHLMQVP